MSTERMFQAAVNVIRGLPKTGPYQPSAEMMLRFYSYFKQATEGHCTKPKPAFWDVKNRVKWESWNGLGNMSSDKAMEAYIYELQKIVETMSYTDNVANFFDTIDGDLPSITREDLELVAGDLLKKFKSSSSSTSSSRDTSPMRTVSQQNGHYESEDEFIDTVDSEESGVPVVHQNENHLIPNGHAKMPLSNQPVKTTTLDVSNDINFRVLEELTRTVGRLEKDITILKERMNMLEKNKSIEKMNLMKLKPSWWPLRSITPGFLVVLIVWPIVANRIVATMRRKRSL
ncbi:uncharacterized protein LOC143919646 isoform X2 [Arctopsyche grandis]|uniref:uncharacterized protein LOC143919646 isoform X2 n=1 Tax=Arctopsyche grandis TaxID=121162 RepID=UPI00406D84EF